MTLPRLLLCLTLPLFVIDQITKFWVVSRFSEPSPGAFASTEWTEVIPGFFNLVRVHNQGVAFGLGNGTDWAPVVFLFVPLIALSLITLGWKTHYFRTTPSKIAVGLLLAGIFGNLTDRLVQGSRLSYMAGESFWERLKAGYVVDFLDFTIPLIQYRWPSFNVADSCVCVAATLLFFTGLREDLAAKKKTPATSPSDA